MNTTELQLMLAAAKASETEDRGFLASSGRVSSVLSRLKKPLLVASGVVAGVGIALLIKKMLNGGDEAEKLVQTDTGLQEMMKELAEDATKKAVDGIAKFDTSGIAIPSTGVSSPAPTTAAAMPSLGGPKMPSVGAPAPAIAPTGSVRTPADAARMVGVTGKVATAGVGLTNDIAGYIKEASGISGIAEPVLLAIAQQESGFKSAAAASTSSAKGLFQFITSTWNAMVAQYGKQYGIAQGDVNNPRANAIMGALYIRQIRDYLVKRLRKEPSATDLYTGHFLGPGGAAIMMSALEKDPDGIAAKYLPAAAKSNPTIFMPKGNYASVREVYAWLYRKIEPVRQQFAQRIETTGTAVAQAKTGADVVAAGNIKVPASAAAVAFNVPPKPDGSAQAKADTARPQVAPKVAMASTPDTSNRQEFFRNRNGQLISTGAS